MNVEVTFFGPFQEAAGEKELTVSVAAGATVRDLFETIGEDHPELPEKVLGEDGELVDSVTVSRNGRDVRLDEGAATELDDGDVLRAAPPVHGG